LADWLTYQFTPAIVDDYVLKYGWELDDAAVVADFARDLIGQPEFTPLRNALSSRRAAGKLNTPDSYRSLVGWRFDSDDHLALSYLVSVYVRGWSYGWSLGEHETQPEYCALWLRNPALRDLSVSVHRDLMPSAATFPWGRVFRELFDPAAPIMPAEFDRVRALALWIRSHRDEIIADAKLGDVQDARDNAFGETNRGPTRAEEVMVRALLDAGGVLPYATASLQDKLLQILRFAAGLLNENAGRAVERITTDIRATWVYRQAEVAEAKFRLAFMRSTFWDVFKNVGIGDVASRTLS
jgi:hypothetical protein